MVSAMLTLRTAVAAGVLFGGGILTGLALASDPGADAGIKVLFDNARVSVKEVTLAPGARRPPRTRATDELVLFPEEAHYQAIEADGKKQPRDRTPGTVVFHNKGELAPTLVNTSAKVVRYYNVVLK
jgi:hypothetical protein